MPSIVIDVCRAYTAAEETALMEAVYAAVVEAFGVPHANRNVVLHVHAPRRFMAKPDCPDPARATNVSLYVLAGRSLEAKRRLYAAIVRKLGEQGVPAGCILIKLHELALHNVAVSGGQAVCDIELGYALAI
ncbi:MAG TPA: tautomerase family protein [Rubrivivax sp.]|nr:tautomerase family protein [Rubrivivax sp.]